MKVYTRTGDDGTTGLVGGKRVKKYDLRLETYGTVDELNSWVGMIRSYDLEESIVSDLIAIQNKLFVIGSHLATENGKIDPNGKLPCCDQDIAMLEERMDKILEQVPPLTHFVLPGGNKIVSSCHIARTVCRRAERRAYELSDKAEVSKQVLIYLNRLSDYFFVLSRKMALDTGLDEIQWKS